MWSSHSRFCRAGHWVQPHRRARETMFMAGGRPAMTPIELETRYCAHNYAPLPVVLARGDGAHVYDTDGRRFIDMMSAYSAASHGHGHPRILKALARQAAR